MYRFVSHICLFFSFLVMNIIQVPVTSWAQDIVEPEIEVGATESLQEPKKKKPRQMIVQRKIETDRCDMGKRKNRQSHMNTGV